MEINTSPDLTNFDFEFLLDISQSVPKAIITDISTYITGREDDIAGIVIRIIDPSNLTITNTVYPPNVDIYPGLTTFQKNLPYFNGVVKFGTYRVYATLIDSEGNEYEWVGDDGIDFKSLNLCKPNNLANATGNYGGLNLAVDPNCDLGKLIVEDGGTGFSYNGVSPSLTEANLTVTYPVDQTGATAQTVATFIPFTIPLTVAGFYYIQGTVTQTYEFSDTTSIKAAYYYQNSFDVQCGYSLCKALCDYEKLWQEVKDCQTSNPNQAMAKFRTFLLITGLLVKATSFKNCGKKFGDLLEQFRVIGGFQCNCDCAPTGITPAPLYLGGGTLVKGNLCGDIDITLTQFLGNIRIDASDVTYDLLVAAASTDFVTVTPIEGDCSKQWQIDIDVCAMLGTVSVSCLSDFGGASPPPSEGDYLIWNGDEWEPTPEPEWEAITFETGFANSGGNRQVGQIRKWHNNKVEVRGDLTTSNFPTDSIISNFGAAYIPASTQHFSVNINRLGTYYIGELQVTNGGEFSLLSNTFSGTVASFPINFYYYTD